MEFKNDDPRTKALLEFVKKIYPWQMANELAAVQPIPQHLMTPDKWNELGVTLGLIHRAAGCRCTLGTATKDESVPLDRTED